MKYTSAAAFRQALEERLKNEAASTGLGLPRLRKRVAFELFLRRLLVVAPDRWVLKGALALDFRLAIATRLRSLASPRPVLAASFFRRSSSAWRNAAALVYFIGASRW